MGISLKNSVSSFARSNSILSSSSSIQRRLACSSSLMMAFFFFWISISIRHSRIFSFSRRSSSGSLRVGQHSSLHGWRRETYSVDVSQLRTSASERDDDVRPGPSPGVLRTGVPSGILIGPSSISILGDDGSTSECFLFDRTIGHCQRQRLHQEKQPTTFTGNCLRKGRGLQGNRRWWNGRSLWTTWTTWSRWSTPSKGEYCRFGSRRSCCFHTAIPTGPNPLVIIP
jgi:hypothetical protein